MILISDFDFQRDKSEGTGTYHLLYAESQNRYKQTTAFGWLYNNANVKRHFCDVYSTKFRILHAWSTVMQTICCFRVSCLRGNMAGTEV